MSDKENYEEVDHPKHYNNSSVEVLEMMKRIWGQEAVLVFCELNAFKYRMRMGNKPGTTAVKDLKKAKYYERICSEITNNKKEPNIIHYEVVDRVMPSSKEK